MGSRNWRYWNS